MQGEENGTHFSPTYQKVLFFSFFFFFLFIFISKSVFKAYDSHWRKTNMKNLSSDLV